MMDTDGSIQLETTPSISITQAQKGFATLEYMYKTFGGRIAHHREATETCQASYVQLAPFKMGHLALRAMLPCLRALL